MQKPSKHQLFVISAISLSVFFLGYFSPQISAIVEPSITINMEAGQTTDPFTIYDSASSEVFAIDTNGIIRPSQGGNPNAGLLDYDLTYENYSNVTVTTADVVADPIVLAMWDISTNGTAKNLTFGSGQFQDNAIMSAYGYRTSGLGQIVLEQRFADVDCATAVQSDFYNNGFGSYVSTASSSPDQLLGFHYIIIEPQMLCAEIIAYNNNGATTGVFEQSFFSNKISVPSYIVITRVI